MKQVNQTIKTGSQMSIVLNFTQYTELLLRKPFKSEICLLLDYLYIYNSVSFVIMDNCFGDRYYGFKFIFISLQWKSELTPKHTHFNITKSMYPLYFPFTQSLLLVQLHTLRETNKLV